jgi:hypothetical protein
MAPRNCRRFGVEFVPDQVAAVAHDRRRHIHVLLLRLFLGGRKAIHAGAIAPCGIERPHGRFAERIIEVADDTARQQHCEGEQEQEIDDGHCVVISFRS